MRFRVQHESLYRYSAPEVLAPHMVRLNPRPQGVQIAKRALTVHPEPDGIVDFDDAFGNRLTRVTFLSYPTDQLRLRIAPRPAATPTSRRDFCMRNKRTPIRGVETPQRRLP